MEGTKSGGDPAVLFILQTDYYHYSRRRRTC